jgi:hypothetical protein
MGTLTSIPSETVSQFTNSRLSFLSEAKNLTFAPCCEFRDSSAAPQNDIATQSFEGEEAEGCSIVQKTS